MSDKTKQLKDRAEKAKHLYNAGVITRAEAKKEVQPYIDHFNENSKEIAKKYNMKPKYISFNMFCR